MSPDGRWLAFQERNHAYVTPMPMASKPITVGAKMDALPVRQLDVDAGEYLSWSGDSAKVHFGLGDRLFTSELRNAFTFVPGAPKDAAQGRRRRRARRLHRAVRYPAGLSSRSPARASSR